MKNYETTNKVDDSKRKWDFVSIVQVIADLMQKEAGVIITIE